MKRSTMIGAVLVSSLGAAALAHSGATGIVLERMNGMSAMKKTISQLAPMMRGETPYDAALVQQGAEVIQSHAGGNMTKLFPQEAVPKASYAVPAIWSQWEAFVDLADLLESQAYGLALAAPNGLMPAAPADPPHDMAGMDGMGMAPKAPAGPSVAQLLGIAPRGKAPATASMQDQPAEASDAKAGFARMAAPAAFEMVSQTCAACHSKFRRGD